MFNQQSIAFVPISGNGGRPSLFGGSIQQGQGFHPTLSRGYWMGQSAAAAPQPLRQSLQGNYWMGQTPSEWYNRAKKALAEFDQLLTRVAQIANKTEREEILVWIGTASDTGSPAYRYATVRSDLQSDVEAFTPPNVNAYQLSRRTNRIEKLEDFNQEFAAKVTNAENVYGRLPQPVVIERERIIKSGGPLPPEPTGTDWTLPLLVGGGAVVVAVAVTLLAGAK